MKKLLLIAALIVALLVPFSGRAAELNNITAAGVDGNLVFYDKSGNIINKWHATDREISIPSGSKIAIESGGTTDIESGGYFKIAGTAVTAAAAEINLIDGSIAGTAVASKAAVLGASKNLDILGLPVGGLKIGAAGAEVAITSDAAEINILDGVTATAAELNFVDGVTSAIQTQLNTKGDKKGIVTLLMSFAAAEQTTTKIYFTSACTINRIRGIVMVAIAATDNGTITCGNSVGASATGVVTATASDALNTEYGVSPTTNNTVAADSYYYLTSAKTTVGGKVLVTLEYTKD